MKMVFQEENTAWMNWVWWYNRSCIQVSRAPLTVFATSAPGFCIQEIKSSEEAPGGMRMRVLAVIDMQNDFIDGVLGTDEAVAIVDRVKAKIEDYLQTGDTIVFTQDTHAENYLDTQEGEKLPVVHCVKGTHGWQIASAVAVEGCPIIEKPAFGSLELAEWIAAVDDVESIELVGLCTDICVIANAMILKAKMPDVPVVVDSSCCAGVSPTSHQNALDAMKVCQIEITGEER